MRLCALLVLATGCFAHSATVPTDDHYVRDIKLSATRGEVGRPFRADITWTTNYLEDDPEISVSGLPPGVALDAGARALVGKPEREGFYTVHVAVRKRARRGATDRPKPDERWWREQFQVEIYKPIE